MDSESLSMGNIYVETMEKHADMVLRICFLYMKNKADAEDMFQNVFLKLCESRPPYDDEEHLKAWLITVARNECRNLLRSFWRRNVTSTDQIVIPVKTKEDKGVISILLNLPTKYRDVIYLYYFEDYKINEISKLLRVKESTIKTRLKRGREILKNLLLQGGIHYE